MTPLFPALARLPDYLRMVRELRRGEATRPRFLTHTLTMRCNARCIMCDSWKARGDDDLTLGEIDAVYRQLPSDFLVVRLTGGEPFVRTDFSEIAGLAQHRLRPLVLHVTTNGFLTDRIVRYCEQRDLSTPLYLLISVDGLGQKHIDVRGVQHAWSSVEETIQVLAPRQQRLNLRLGLNQTIVDVEGLDHISRLRSLFGPRGVEHNTVLAYRESSTYNVDEPQTVTESAIGQFTPFGEFTEAELERLFREMERGVSWRRPGAWLLKRRFVRYLRDRMLHTGDSRPSPCVALRAHLRIFPNGDVPVCQFNTRVVGNLRTETLAAVWQSVRAWEERRWVDACPGCGAECEQLFNSLADPGALLPILSSRRGAPPSAPVGGGEQPRAPSAQSPVVSR
jgi:MoaA/NifB/PqqE/SkfB family radical SAM enzyme